MADQPSSTNTNRPRDRKPTLHDLAEAAGVSFSLAGKVMRGSAGASEATKARIQKVAEEIGYRPDLAARFLRRGHSRLIGVAYRLNSPYLSDVVKAIYAAAGAANYDVVLGGWFDAESERKAVTTLLGHRAAAIILIGPTTPSAELAEIVDTEPVITLYVRKSLPASDSVVTDEGHGMRLLVDHLVELGHRSIVHVDGGSGVGVASEARRLGYLDAMRANGLGTKALILPGGETLEAGVRAAERFTELPAGSTAIVAYNDESAHGLIDRLRELGRIVPDDVSVTGFDGGRFATFLPQHLTTIRQDNTAYAQVAIRRVVDRLELGVDGGEHTLLEPTLIIGRSTRSI